MIRVAVVDDHPVARYGLMTMLAPVPDIEVVAAVADPAALPSGAGAVDVVMCDPYPFGEVPSHDTVRNLASWATVLVVSASRGAADVLAALQAGARGYLTKHAGDEAYVTAIRCVAAGGSYLTTQLRDVLRASTRPGGAAPGSATLSEREQQVLAFIARGFTISRRRPGWASPRPPLTPTSAGSGSSCSWATRQSWPWQPCATGHRATGSSPHTAVGGGHGGPGRYGGAGPFYGLLPLDRWDEALVEDVRDGVLSVAFPVAPGRVRP